MRLHFAATHKLDILLTVDEILSTADDTRNNPFEKGVVDLDAVMQVMKMCTRSRKHAANAARIKKVQDKLMTHVVRPLLGTIAAREFRGTVDVEDDDDMWEDVAQPSEIDEDRVDDVDSQAEEDETDVGQDAFLNTLERLGGQKQPTIVLEAIPAVRETTTSTAYIIQMHDACNAGSVVNRDAR